MADKKFAILIDGDNINNKYIKIIIDEVAKEGTITYKRIYGDWTAPNLSPWKEVLLEFSINPIQQYAYTKGKNATDSAMIIDAMDILYTGNVDGFCLVSSDSDFTKLAARLKESGKIVIGMGEKKTPKPFVSACSMFKYIDILLGDKNTEKDDCNKKQEQEEIALTKENEIKNMIKIMIEENADASGWVLASTIGTLLQKKYPEFDCRNYGCKKMIDLLKKFKFDIKVSTDNSTYLVKQK